MTITAAVCSMYVSTLSGAGTLYLYRGVKPFYPGDNEGATADVNECSWNDWAAADSEWATGGCKNRSGSGDYNTGDGSGADTDELPFDTVSNITETGWISFDCPAVVQDWYDGYRGCIVLVGSGDYPGDTLDCQFYSIEAGTNEPRFVVTYESGGEEETSGRRRRLLGGQ